MTSPAAEQRKSIREAVGIGQLWQRRGAEVCIEITQIHRADRLVEARHDGPDGPERQAITFAELKREYELVAVRDVA